MKPLVLISVLLVLVGLVAGVTITRNNINPTSTGLNANKISSKVTANKPSSGNIKGTQTTPQINTNTLHYPRCHANQIHAGWFDWEAGGGSETFVVVLANVSNTPCSLEGYAKIASFDLTTGQYIPYGQGFQDVQANLVTPVNLFPGQVATFLETFMTYYEVLYPNAKCVVSASNQTVEDGFILPGSSHMVVNNYLSNKHGELVAEPEVFTGTVCTEYASADPIRWIVTPISLGMPSFPNTTKGNVSFTAVQYALEHGR